MNLKQMAESARYGKGKSEAAIQRRADRNRGATLTGKPGDSITDSRGRTYTVAADGSHRRAKEAK